MRTRKQSRENAGMRRIGDRARGKSLDEPDTILRQRIQGRGRAIGVPVAVNVVCSKRIDSYEEDVRKRRLRGDRGCYCPPSDEHPQPDERVKSLHRFTSLAQMSSSILRGWRLQRLQALVVLLISDTCSGSFAGCIRAASQVLIDLGKQGMQRRESG